VDAELSLRVTKNEFAAVMREKHKKLKNKLRNLIETHDIKVKGVE
jgi:predicted outer membrane protein